MKTPPIINAVVCLATSSGAAPLSENWIAVSHRSSDMICAGLCIEETVRVNARGEVSWTAIDPFRHRLMVLPAKLMVERPAAASFIKIMQNEKLAIERNGAQLFSCETKSSKTVWMWDIWWESNGPHVRAPMCDNNQQIIGVWRKALRALGMPGGLVAPWGPRVRLVSRGRWESRRYPTINAFDR